MGRPSERAPEEGGAELARVQRAARGDRAAFADLVRIHRARVQRVALRLVGSPEDAEDIAQETFVRAWHGLKGLGDERRFGSWLLAISVHLCRDHLRARGRRAEESAARLLETYASEPTTTQSRGFEPMSPEPGPGARATESELRARVELAIAALPPKLRIPFVLRAIEGESYSSVARITKARPATVRTWMVQARRALRRSLGPLIDTEDTHGKG